MLCHCGITGQHIFRYAHTHIIQSGFNVQSSFVLDSAVPLLCVPRDSGKDALQNPIPYGTALVAKMPACYPATDWIGVLDSANLTAPALTCILMKCSISIDCF